MAVTVPIQNKVDVAGLTKKWEKWLKGVQTDEKRTTLAIMLENQHKYNKMGLLKEATVSGDAGAFQKVILPVIRRVFPRLVAPELVGVQPMTGPTGLAIFLKYFYEADAGTKSILQPEGAADGRRIYMREYESGPFLRATTGVLAGNGLITGIGTLAATFDHWNGGTARVFPGVSGGTGAAFDSWKGSGKFMVNVEVSTTGANAFGTIVAECTASYGAAAPTWTATWTQTAGAPVTFTYGTAAAGVVAQDALYLQLPAIFTGAGATGLAQFVLTTDSAAVGPETIVGVNALPEQHAGTTGFVGSVFYEGVFLKDSCPVLVANGLEQAAPASLSVKFETHPIVAEDYKLQATWSLEAAQDINALHGESLEEVLSNLLTQELMNEIDYIVVRDLLNMAAISGVWNKFPGTTPISTTIDVGGGEAYAVPTSMPAYRGTLRDWWETLVFLMNDTANSIHTRILRGPANFAVVSPDVSTILESLPEFKSASLNDLDTEVGIVPVGTLTSKYKLYKDARLAKGTMLMGYKGQDSRNTGYIYAPYVPATLSPIIWDPQTYNNKRMIMTRFGRTTLLDGQYFYARIRVTENSTGTTDWLSY